MADLWMDVDVALSEVPVNLMPLIDDTDFKSREVAIAYNAAGMDLVWNFVTPSGAFTQTAVTPTTAGVYDWTHQGDGMYTIEIPASGGASINNDTKGFGWFTGHVTGVLPWRGPVIGFRSAIVNNALVDSDTFLDNKDLGIWLESLITTVNSQTSFDLTESITLDDTWIGHQVVIEDTSTGDFHETWITDVVAASNRIIINEAAGFTVVTSDVVRVYKDKHPRYEINDYAPSSSADVTSAKNSILGKLLDYFQLALRKDAAIATDNATALGEINQDEASGAGTFDNTTDSIESIGEDSDSIKAKTDQLTFTNANEVDANAKSANDTTILGAGVTANKWRGS